MLTSRFNSGDFRRNRRRKPTAGWINGLLVEGVALVYFAILAALPLGPRAPLV
jgi:hypothetical protein